MPRRRFQKGNIIIRGKTPTRYGMYREDVLQSDGTFKQVRRCVVLGPVSSYRNVQHGSYFNRILTA